MGIINSVIGLLNDFDFGQVWKYVEYQIYYEDYVCKFEAMQKKLKDRVEDVEAELETQLKQPGKKARKEVDAWREEAHKETTVKVEDLICRGGYFTFIWSSRNLDEKTEELKRILEEGKEFTNVGVSLVIDDHSKKGVPMPAEKCIARDDVQEEILQLLRGDKVTRIAVCGMGGVGKTTIMKQVYNHLLKEPKLNQVIWVKVSKDFDIIVEQKKQFDVLKFQKRIARKLGIELKNEDQETTELAELISQTLQQRNCVLILDDVWEPFSPEIVGIPDLLGNNGCKLVLTTRIQQKVARAMECEVILVKPLSDDEASRLFLDKVGSALLSNPKFKSDIEPFFNQILKKCNGLPLAIGTVAKTMKGKFDRCSWEMADKELSNSEEFFDCLKFSYDHLEELCKNCFLYCALYPEDHEIPKEELIECLIEEGFIKDGRGSRHLMNSEGHVILGKLIDNCMLELVTEDEEVDCVSMHDLLREMALNISPRFMVKAGMALEELPEAHEWREDLLKVSLMNNSIREIPSSMLSPKCPVLTTLLLSSNNITTIPEAFFDQMLGLKILDLSGNYKLGRLPSSVSKLENLTTLLLEDCRSLKEILKKCNGLPLAIGTVAKTMKGKFDRYSWEMADKELSNSEEFFDCLKFSYEHLEELCKNCFLYCALYPEDHEISKEELIECLIEEGFIKDGRGSRHLMNSEGHVILGKLIDNCMLELVKQDKKVDCVSMHDLLREMALNISPRFMVKAGMALEELPEAHEWREDLLKVSLMNNSIREIPSSMSSPKCPMLTTLLLSNNNITTIPEAFFDQMLGLKILDLSRNYKLGRLPSSVSKLENLTTLLLEDCQSLKEVPSLSNFRALKKLDLSRTSIEELPQGLNMSTNMKFLHLGGKLFEIPDGLLQNLSNLQYLLVDLNIPLKGEEIGKLRKLEFLYGRFSTVDDMSLFVNSKRKLLNGYWFCVGSHKEVEKVHQMLASFSISAKCILYRNIDICGEATCLPSDAQGFYILDCKHVKILDDISGFQNATDLRGCVVDRCAGLEFVVSLCCLKPLRNIELLSLYYLPNLNAVFEKVGTIAKPAPLPAGTFSLLQKIKVVGCGKIKKLLPLGLSLYLQNLQTIKVKECDQMEEIIWSEDGGGEKAPEKLTLPKLERLVLDDLPALKSIYSGFSTVLICDSIKRVEIKGCGNIESVFWSGFNPLPTLEYLQLWSLENLKSVFDEEALGLSAPSTTFFSLKTIDVYNCPKLKKVFSLGWLLRYFQSLETIEVDDCNQMEELFSSSPYEEIETLEKITLPNLQSLELKKLPELKSICSSSSVLICDSIRILKIVDCEKLKRIPLHLSSLDNGQPPSLKQVEVYPQDCWESLEWDQSNAKDVLPSVNSFGMR
ncbi:hypothetical protein SLEP1_g46275 [Rubroshorea leprosula]|uniref:AAA+ ATPase domain-containing protein n=1 Tax=Rubroshorea leprosula TaxID=152421 RepID=A0AAV5LLS4_9ROSI|nr:hypothetical protein SLEP1_g46275 [Rubroshorea leprosula]